MLWAIPVSIQLDGLPESALRMPELSDLGLSNGCGFQELR
jgi:hypothetical protein